METCGTHTRAMSDTRRVRGASERQGKGSDPARTPRMPSPFLDRASRGQARRLFILMQRRLHGRLTCCRRCCRHRRLRAAAAAPQAAAAAAGRAFGRASRRRRRRWRHRRRPGSAAVQREYGFLMSEASPGERSYVGQLRVAGEGGQGSADEADPRAVCAAQGARPSSAHAFATKRATRKCADHDAQTHTHRHAHAHTHTRAPRTAAAATLYCRLCARAYV